MRYRRLEILLFAFTWISYAYFHQGGGWNQNGRFAMARALVEQRQPWIDDYFVYASNGPKGSPSLRRIPVRNGGFSEGGRLFALVWYDKEGARTPLAPDAPADAYQLPADWAGVTGDLAFAYGHLHPNKAPGTSFAAVPGYSVVLGLERLLGVDPDAAWVLTVNAWLAGVLSVGLVAALGVVVFWRLAMRISGNRTGAAIFATLTLAFGTLYFPYATMLFEHDLVAVALLGAFHLALDARSPRRLFAAGLCAAASIVASYLSVLAVLILGLYIVWRVRRPSGILAFIGGSVPPLVMLAVYNVVCFGRLVATNYAWENPLFKRAGGGLPELFGAPRADVLLALLASPMRGLLAGTPVLVLGAIGLIAMFRRPQLRPEGYLCAAMIAHMFLFNMTFTAWNGGWACGPRYLIPALPFLALPIAIIPPRAAWVRHTMLAVSIAAMALATAVDPQSPPTASAIWRASPIWHINLPQLLHGRPGAFATDQWPSEVVAMYIEPVSANPNGFYSGAPGRLFPLGSVQTRWNSFNMGEFLFPGSRLSLLPWMVLATIFGLLLRREHARHVQGAV